VRSAILVPVLLLAACGASRPSTVPPPPAATPAIRSGVDLAGMDRIAIPGSDFYAYANGTWLAGAVIPPERSSTGPWLQVVETVNARVRAIDEEAARAGAAPGTELQQIGDTYASFLDEAGIEARGLEPLRPTMVRIAALPDRRALAAELGGSIRADVDPLNATSFATSNVLGLWVEQDLNVPGRNAAYLLQGGLVLPDRSYYLDEGGSFDEIRVAYGAYLVELFRLAGAPVAEAEAKAARVVALETRIARTHASRTDSNDVRKGNNPWSRHDLDAKAPGMDWTAFLAAARLEGQAGFIVWHPGAVTGLAELVRTEPLQAWKDLLAAHALDRAAPYLPAAFVEAHFRLHGTTLEGTPRNLERWKRAVAVTDEAVGDAVGKIYVSRHFPPEAKRELQEMVARILAAFDRRIEAVAWMAPATKAQARAKLAGMRVGVAYPDAWRSYAGLRVVRGDALGNFHRAELHAYGQALARLARLPDRAEWAMLAQTVNALNLPVRNALNFPAAILEPPFYDRDASPAVKYAAIGAIIGHEVSHGFDDQGALFDAAGRLATWWTPEDTRAFDAAGARLVAQYDAYRPFPDLAVNGRLTLSENIADLAGLAAAYDGWRDSLGGKEAPVLDGLGGDEQFFLSFGQTWRTKMREQALRDAILTDGHAPARYRALTVRNLDAWYPTFGVKPGQGLYLAPEDRVRVW